MKRIWITTLLLLGALSSYASDPWVISGIWDRGGNKKRDTEVKLYRVVSGRIEKFVTFQLQEDNHFGFAFNSREEGFYVIGSGSDNSAQNKYVFYFKPGDHLNIAVNDSTYELVGKNTVENEAMTKWHNYISLLEYKSVYFASRPGSVNGQTSTYVDFFPLLTKYAEKVRGYKSKTGNKRFDNEFERFREYDVLRYAYTFLLTPRTAHPEKEDYPDFYRNVDINGLTATTQLLDYPYGAFLLQNCVYITNELSEIKAAPQAPKNKQTIEELQKQEEERRNNLLSLVKNDTLAGELVANFAKSVKTNDEYQKFNNEYGKYILTTDQKKRMNEIFSRIISKDPVLRTVDFSGTDLNDKKVSLSDFKGKVVVVDVWATWCGPCRKEIPYLKAIEKDYHDKDVVFLSISLDEVKNKEKWIQFVKDEELTGVQLFGGNGLNSDVAKFYKIKGIPRFMLFDKNGNVVTEDAPRPSNPELKKMIDEKLK